MGSGPANQSTEDAETLNLLWKPNLEIYGLQEFKKHHILGEMAGLRVSRSKEVTFDIKVTIEISCLMDFSDYPFDDHTCNFQVKPSVSFLRSVKLKRRKIMGDTG